jgi:hypothetical protein
MSWMGNPKLGMAQEITDNSYRRLYANAALLMAKGVPGAIALRVA